MAHRKVKQRVCSGPDCLNIPSQLAYSGPDCFNKLSDDIIIDCILPFLDLKQRMRSSVLSRRWRNMWRYTLGGNLVFPHGLEAWDKVYHDDGPGAYLGCHFKCEHVENKRMPYLNWVHSTLISFAGPELDCFSVCYDLDSRFSRVVDFWLMRAIWLRVKKLHLHFRQFRGRTPDNNYKFPSADKLSRFPCLDLDAYLPCTLGIWNLKEISLEFVDIDSQTVEYLLSICPLLEFISLKKAACQYLKIVGPSLKLKYLHVLGCSPLEKLDISAPNLITLKYDGPKEALFLTSIPRVEHLGISGTYFKQIVDELRQRPLPHFGGYFAQLKSLEFEMTSMAVEESTSYSRQLPMLIKLEEVKVKMYSRRFFVLLWPCCLLKSAPRLKKFVVEQRCVPDTSRRNEENYNRMTAVMEEATKCKHPCLKVIEYVGFGGIGCEMKLAQHLVSCAESLEKLVIDTGGKLDKLGDLNNFRRIIPSNAQLILL